MGEAGQGDSSWRRMGMGTGKSKQLICQEMHYKGPNSSSSPFTL